MKTLNKPGIMLFIGILAVSTASILIRNAQNFLPSNLVAAGRLIFATLILAPFSGKTALREFISLEHKQQVRITLAGIFLGIHFLVWIKSLELTSIASSVILVTTTPIWVALFSPLFLKEKVSKNVVFGLTIAMIGIVVLFIGPAARFQLDTLDMQTLLGNFLALVGAWMAAAYTMVGRSVRDEISLKSYVFLVYGIAALVAVLFAIPDLSSYSNAWVYGLSWVFLLGLIPQVIGHTLFNAAVRKMDAVYASIALLGEPVGSILLAWIFLQEKPGRYDLVGGLFVITGILLAFLLQKARIQDQERP
ncbi:MAG: DMT family transporter [Anaerolineaceae bacterium]